MKGYKSFLIMILVLSFSFVCIDCGGGGGGGDDGGGAGGGSGRELFPTNEETYKAAEGTSFIVDLDGQEVEIAGTQIIAKFEQNANTSDYNELKEYLQKRGATIVGQVPETRKVQIEAAFASQIMLLINDIEKLPYIEDAYPNEIVVKTSNNVPPNNDLSYFEGKTQFDWMKSVNVAPAWNDGHHGSPNQIISIIEAGGVGERERLFEGQPAIIGDYKGIEHEVHEHATSMAALAAGDSAEIVGICPDCQIVSYDVSGYFLEEFEISATHAIDWGIRRAAEKNSYSVINVSYGPQTEGRTNDEFLKKVRKFRWRIREAVEIAAKYNCLVIFSAGNMVNFYNAEDSSLFPSDTNIGEETISYYENLWEDHVLIVTAAESDNYTISGYPYGNMIRLAAPTDDFVSLIKYSGEVYADMGRTSAAAALVSGAAGLIWSVDPSLEPNEIIQRLIGNGNPTNHTDDFNLKSLNVYESIITCPDTYSPALVVDNTGFDFDKDGIVDIAYISKAFDGSPFPSPLLGAENGSYCGGNGVGSGNRIATISHLGETEFCSLKTAINFVPGSENIGTYFTYTGGDIGDMFIVRTFNGNEYYKIEITGVSQTWIEFRYERVNKPECETCIPGQDGMSICG